MHANQAGARPADQAADAVDISTCRVLLVDDNAQNLELLQAYMEELGCEIRTSTDGPEALEDIAKHPPELVLLDIMMPRMSGFQVCRKITSDPATAHIKVLMVTALNEVADVERAKEVGAHDFVTKPVNKVELLTRVRNMLRVAVLERKLQKTMAEVRRLSDRPTN